MIALLVVVLWAAFAFALEGVDYKIENGGNWKSYVDDGVYLLASPDRWDGGDWLMVGTVAAVTTGLYVFDAKISDFIQQNRNGTTDGISSVFTHAGEEVYLFPGLAVLYLYGNGYADDRAQRTALLSLESWFYSSALTFGLKEVSHRTRPNDGASDVFAGPSLSNPNDSFPSGHASTAFSIATVVASEYEDVVLVPPIAYGVAALVDFSRLNDNQHWSSDVFFSSATGYFIAKAIVKRHAAEAGPKITIIPVITPQSALLLFSVQF